MAIVINGSGTVTGISVGGLPDSIVDSGTLASNAVTEAKIASSAVVTAKLNDDAVTNAKVAANAIAEAQLAANAVVTGKIEDGTIAAGDLASGVGGKVLQVVQATGSTGSTTTSSTITRVGDVGTITPSATSSKILVTITGTLRFGGSGGGVIAMHRDIAGAGYSEIQSFSRHTAYQNHSTGNYVQGQFVSMSYLDSPSTTSACNYKAAINTWDSGQTTYWLPNPSHQDQTTIIMMEIAG